MSLVIIRCFFLSEERDELYHYIDTRCEAMLKAGLFEEVTQLLIQNYMSPDSVAARAIGYRQTIDYLCMEPWKPFDVKSFENYVRLGWLFYVCLLHKFLCLYLTTDKSNSNIADLLPRPLAITQNDSYNGTERTWLFYG
jgi:hypothetical protein